MKTKDMICNAFIIDTYKIGKGQYIPGAITFYKRRKLNVIHWVRMECATQEEANEYVREQFAKNKLKEAKTELDLKR